MHCDACAESVERAVSRLEGVEEVNVDLASESAFVRFNEQLVSQVELNQAVFDAGFEVSSE